MRSTIYMCSPSCKQQSNSEHLVIFPLCSPEDLNWSKSNSLNNCAGKSRSVYSTSTLLHTRFSRKCNLSKKAIWPPREYQIAGFLLFSAPNSFSVRMIEKKSTPPFVPPQIITWVDGDRIPSPVVMSGSTSRSGIHFNVSSSPRGLSWTCSLSQKIEHFAAQARMANGSEFPQISIIMFMLWTGD